MKATDITSLFLSRKTQLSNINDFVISDFDNDGVKDVIVCGNSNDAAVMVGNYDATAALMLKGKRKGTLRQYLHTTDGFKVRASAAKWYTRKTVSAWLFLKQCAAQIYQHN